MFGYLLDQRAWWRLTRATPSGSQAGFVKVVFAKGLSTSKIDAIRKEIAAKRFPQAEGDTVRDGAIVYGNFSAYNDSIETLTDEQFTGCHCCRCGGECLNQIGVSEPVRFHSEYDQAYWDDEKDLRPEGREAYLEKTRYANNPIQDEAGRDDVRRWGRDSVLGRGSSPRPKHERPHRPTRRRQTAAHG